MLEDGAHDNLKVMWPEGSGCRGLHQKALHNSNEKLYPINSDEQQKEEAHHELIKDPILEFIFQRTKRIELLDDLGVLGCNPGTGVV